MIRALLLVLGALVFQAAELAVKAVPAVPAPQPDRSDLRRELDGLRMSLASDWAWLANFHPRDEADSRLARAVYISTIQRRQRRDEIRQILTQ